MNGKTVNVSKTDDVISLYREVVAVREAVERLYKKIVRVLPAKEGTEEWWEKEIELSLEEYRAGKYKTYKSVDEFINSI